MLFRDLDLAEQNLILLVVDSQITTRTGVAFQDYFVDLALKRWGSDFEPRRAQGQLGDGKCDGLRISTQQVFQVYAPRSMKPSVLVSKISEDFNGALAEFGEKMKQWTLVHNDREALPKLAADKLSALRIANRGITIDQIGPQVLLEFVLDISVDKLRLLHPNVPTSRDIRRVQFRDIDVILAELEGLEPLDPLREPMPPREDKIEYNGFSEHVASTLRLGYLSFTRFRSYFLDTSRTNRGTELAQRFRAHYLSCRDAGMHGDEIFFSLCDAAGGLSSSRERSSGIIGFCTYLFHCCDVFEDGGLIDPS